jgi:hypothetical protein
MVTEVERLTTLLVSSEEKKWSLVGLKTLSGPNL